MKEHQQKQKNASISGNQNGWSILDKKAFVFEEFGSLRLVESQIA